MRVLGNLLMGDNARVNSLAPTSASVFPAKAMHGQLMVLNQDIQGFARGTYQYDALTLKWVRIPDMETIAALIQSSTKWAIGCRYIGADETVVVPDKYQMTVHGTLRIYGTLEIRGEVCVL